MRKSFPILSFILIIIGSGACNDKPDSPKVVDRYNLEFSPENHLFPAKGGRVKFSILAEKNITTYSDGNLQNIEKQEAPYTVSVEGEGFSIDGFEIIAEKNEGEKRTGSVTVALNEISLTKSISLTQEAAEQEPAKREITNVKVLAIGNSFSADAVEQYLYELADANEDTILVGNMYIGSASLQLHHTNFINNSSGYSYRKVIKGAKTTTPNFKLIDAIKDEEWDYITLQQSSSNSGLYNTYFPYLEQLITLIKQHATNPGVEVLLHTTWAYAQNSTHSGFANYGKNQTTMFESIVDASKRAAEQAGIKKTIPSGTAIQNGRTSSLGDTFCRDGYHLELNYGRYTGSCTWYEVLFEKEVTGNSYIPSNITPFQAKVAQYAARYAVENPYGITSLVSLVDDTPTVSFDSKINISFASKPDHSRWNLLLGHTAGSIIENLEDIDGGITDVSIEVVERFGGVNSNGPTSTTTGMNMPSGATTKSFFGNREPFNSGTYPKSTIKFSSLNPAEPYSFEVFASRTNSNDNRETYYSFHGATNSDTTVYLNASNNTSKTVKALNIKPNEDGEITIEMGPGPNNNNSLGFFYITAMSIEAR